MTTPPQFTVLIVDDNRELLAILEEGLLLAGPFRVITAENGIEGLEKCFDMQPDCIVIDVKMPELDGNQLVRALRGDPASAQTPLVMLTALSQEHDRLRSTLSGVDYYLLKPVKPRELAQTVLTAITRSQEDRQRQVRELVEEIENPSV